MMRSDITNSPAAVQAFSVDDLFGDIPETPVDANDLFGDLAPLAPAAVVEVAPALVPDPDTAIAFLRSLRPNGIHQLVALRPDAVEGKKNQECLTVQLKGNEAHFRDFILTWHSKGWGVYYSTNAVKAGLYKKAAKADATHLYGIYCDVDPEPVEGNEDPVAHRAEERARLLAKAEAMARDAVAPPTFVVDSGGGIQATWLLDTPVEATPDNIVLLEAHGCGLAQKLREEGYCADKVQDVNRLLRLPGSINFPKGKKRLQGQRPALARLLHAGGRRYTVEELALIAPAIDAGRLRRASGSASIPAGSASIEVLPGLLAKLPLKYRDERAEWLKVLFACKFEWGDEAWEAFDEWSSESPNYDLEQNRMTWEREHPRGDVHYGSLAYWAREGEAVATADEVFEEIASPELDMIEAAAGEAKVPPPPPPPPPPTMAELLERAKAMSNSTRTDEIKEVLGAAVEIGADVLEMEDLLATLKTNTEKRIGALRALLKDIRKGRGGGKDLAESIAKQVLHEEYEGHLLRTADRSYWRYTGAAWTPVSDEIVFRACKEEAARHDVGDKGLRKVADDAARLMVAESIRDGDPLGLMDEPKSVINCRNGELWIDSVGGVELRKHDPKSFLTSCLPIKYDPAATCPRFDRALLEIFAKSEDPAAMARHWNEFLGYLIQPSRKIASWWLLHGRGGNGKSFLMDVAEALLPQSAVLSVNIGEWSKRQFARGQLLSKLLVKDDDVDSKTVIPDGFLKTISERKTLTGEKKFKDEFNFVSVALPVLLANGWPSLSDPSDGTQRRVRVIPFRRSFSREGIADLGLKDYIIENELPGVLNRAIEGACRLFARGDFDEPEDCRQARETFLGASNPVLTFIGACCVVDGEAKTPGMDLHDRYKVWVEAEGGKALTRTGLYNKLEEAGYPDRPAPHNEVEVMSRPHPIDRLPWWLFRAHERDARWLAVIGDTVVELTKAQADVLSALLAAGEAGIPGGPRGQVIRVANALGLVVQTVLGKPGERLRYRLVGPAVRLVGGAALACQRNSEHDCRF